MMNQYVDRREVENIYDKARKRIKEQIELKGVSMKGTTKGNALSEIMAVIDREMGIGIAEEMITARKVIREYYDKYSDVRCLENEIYKKKKELEEQNKVAGVVSMLTDETLKNAILAYNAIKDTSRDSHNAKEIAIAYIKSKGRDDLKEVIEASGGAE